MAIQTKQCKVWSMGVVRIVDRCDGSDNNFNLLRMFAATGVLVSHAYPISFGESVSDPLKDILRGQTLGSMSVVIFFAISGFFIARSYERTSSLGSFIRARALRLFPALAVMLLLTILACAAFTTADSATYWAATPEYFLRNVTFYFPLYNLPGVFEANPLVGSTNGSLWTLRVEVTLYIGVALIGLTGILYHRPVFSALYLGLIAFCAFAMMQGMSRFLHWHENIEALLLLMLAFGCGVAFWVWREKVRLSFWLALAGLGIAVLSWPTPLFDLFLVLSVSYAVFVLGYASLPLLPAYNRLGDYSYGTYVYAFPIQQIVAWTGVTSPALNIAIALPLTLICAVLSWHLIEAPALKWKRGGRTSHIAPAVSK